MATPVERRALIKQNSTAKIIWYVLLALQALSLLAALAAAFGVGLLGSVLAFGSGALGGIVLVVGLLIAAFGLLVFFGVYNIEKWVIWLMWLSVIGNISNIFHAKVTGIISLLILIGYYYLLDIIKKSGAPVTPVAPIQTPPVIPPQA